jgi:hypothetical protein
MNTYSKDTNAVSRETYCRTVTGDVKMPPEAKQNYLFSHCKILSFALGGIYVNSGVIREYQSLKKQGMNRH